MNDLKFAFRQLLKNPGFTTVAVLTLALGIGANTAIFTVINSVLLRSLPVKNPDELIQVVVRSESPRPDYTFSYPLSVLGVEAKFGRAFATSDDQVGNAQAVVVISHSFWERRFGADPAIVGKAITFDDVPFTIVGVTPPAFFGFQPGENPDLWWPLQMTAQIDRDPSAGRLEAGTHWLRLVGRLSNGVERRQAEAELRTIYERYRDEFAASRAAKWSADLRRRYMTQKLELWTAHAGWTYVRDQFRQPLMILMTVVAVVLLIACANVASLLLARAATSLSGCPARAD